MANLTMQRKVEKTARILKNLYGEPKPWIADTPLDCLIAVILSQNTSDKNSFPAFANLKKLFPTWEQVIVADEKKIANAIQRGGLANIKAKRIKSVLAEIKQKTGKLDISFLSQVPTEQAREFLTSLNGVGPKSAAVVLSFAFNKPTFPVDTHVFRVTRRLGLHEEKTPEKAQKLESLVPDKLKQSYHLNLIRLGREVCISRKPRCGECPLNNNCNYYKTVFKKQKSA